MLHICIMCKFWSVCNKFILASLSSIQLNFLRWYGKECLHNIIYGICSRSHQPYQFSPSLWWRHRTYEYLRILLQYPARRLISINKFYFSWSRLTFNYIATIDSTSFLSPPQTSMPSIRRLSHQLIFLFDWLTHPSHLRSHLRPIDTSLRPRSISGLALIVFDLKSHPHFCLEIMIEHINPRSNSSFSLPWFLFFWRVDCRICLLSSIMKSERHGW